ncbi:RNA pyrophosphohydrolase [Methylobacterium planeticum]|uniref:RNA pyrophosphohydrolase n=1 Tax=Methylobacterium planeticum TaxID=2615211 RepID=A0A6N6MZV1_9HYPH|nr:RNA pyrophosphohydrolase [Methylobacterium planeticum]KAB1076150.1 RNA pyrophosphohydrolase [Methylobacterium planeticum]
MTRAHEFDAGRDPAGLPYRPCVGITLINRSGRVFIGRRRKEGGPEHVSGDFSWQMPQGGIDPGEDPRAAAMRELYEETNVPDGAIRFLDELPDWLPYDLPPDVMKQAWKGRYRGQTQKWFAFGFLGQDAEIDVVRPGGGQHPSEFETWRWEAFEAIPGLIIPFKRPVYDAVVSAFSRHARWHAGA